MADVTHGSQKYSEQGNKGKSIDHHGIEAEKKVPDHGDAADPNRKAGSLPLEHGNQYTHKKPEKS